MFTGLVEEVGTIQNVRRGARSCVLTIGCKKVLEGSQIGDSIAVNGVCLTVTEHGWQLLHRRCHGRDHEPQFSGAVKYRGIA